MTAIEWLIHHSAVLRRNVSDCRVKETKKRQVAQPRVSRQSPFQEDIFANSVNGYPRRIFCKSPLKGD